MNVGKNIVLVSLLSAMLPNSANAQSINYEELETIFGEPITTSENGKPQRASDSHSALEIITYKEIQKSGAKDIPQLLQRIKGVEVRRAYIGQAEVAIRGYNQAYSNRLLVLINGKQALSDSYGQVEWGMLPIEMNEIRQIEIVKGPNTSLFGFNAESGVINIITFSPLKDDIDVATLKLGVPAHREGSVITTGQYGNKAIRLSTSMLVENGFSRDHVPQDSYLASEKTAILKRHAGADFEWQINKTSNLRLGAQFVNGEQDKLIPFTADNNEHEKAQLSANYKHANSLGLWDANLYFNNDQSKYTVAGYNNDLYVANISNLYQINPKNLVRTALEYRKNTIDGVVFNYTKFSSNLIAPSIMWNYKATDKLSITNAMRYDNIEYKRTADSLNYTQDEYDRKLERTSFNSAVKYSLSDTDNVRFSVSRGSHLPSLLETGSELPFGGGLAFGGNPYINVESMTAYEIGYNKNLPKYNTKFDASIFLQDLKNVVSPTYDAGKTLISFKNAGESKTYGLEVGVTSKYNDWLDWGANYTYLKTDDDLDGNIYFEDNQPKHQVSVFGGFEYKDWEFNGDLHYVSSAQDNRYFIDAAAGSPPVQTINAKVNRYFVLNARAAYNVTENTSIALEGYNLVHKHREWGGQLVSGLTTGGVDQVGGNILGKSLLFTLKHKF